MATLAELKELALLAREEGDEDLEIKALEAIASMSSQQSAPIQQPQEPVRQFSGGRTARARQIQEQSRAEKEQFLSSLPPERRALLESISPFEASLIGVGRGFVDIGRGLGIADQGTEDEFQAFRELEEVHPEATGGQIVGQAAPFVPLGIGASQIGSTLGRTAAVSGVGAAEGGIITRGQGGDFGEQIFAAGIGGSVAGALELGLPVLGRIGGKIIRRITGRPPKGAVVDASGNMSDELITALRKEGLEPQDIIDEALVDLKGQAVDPEQAARQAFLQSQGIEPTKAQVTQLASDFMDQQELAKRTSKVRAALQRQDATLTTRFNNAVLETGGTASTPTNTVVDSITEKATALDNEISNLYKQAREIAPEQKNVRFEGLDGMLKKLAPQNRKGGFNVESVVGDLKSRGVLDSKGKLVGKVDVRTAEDIRQSINELYDPANPFGNIQLRLIKEKLDDDVFRSAGGDVFKQARKAKADFEQGLKRAKVSKFDSRKANLVRDVLENKVNPDTFTKDVVFSKRWRAEDLTQLKNYLQADDAGKQAFDNLRADVMQEIKDRAFKGVADESGLVPITRDKLERAISSIGKEKLGVLFNPNEVKFLDDMLKVSKLREPVVGTAIGEGPSGAAINKQANRLMNALDKLGVISDAIESVSVNAQGRVAVKPKPDKIVRPIAGSVVRPAIALGGAAATTQALGDEQ